MAREPFMRTVAIAGVAESECGRGTGLTVLQHQALAAKRALDDAGLTLSDVDAVMAVDFLGLPSLQIAEYLGIKLKFTDTTVTGGGSLWKTFCGSPRGEFCRFVGGRVLIH